MTFQELRKANVTRCRTSFKHELTDWSEAEWGNAVAGETGELCNLLKKRLRGEDIPLWEVAEEIADVAIYLDLLCALLGISFEESIRLKFNRTSDKKGSSIKL